MCYILLVEDNQANADMMIRLLATANLPVRHFVRGVEGVREAYRERPILILMDFNLPDIDGRTLILSLKKRLGGASAPPIIAVTARTGRIEETMARQFGCDAFVRKPFDPQEFLNVVMQFVNAKKPTQPEEPKIEASPDKPA
jgi:DNA-binding response OmpR family regulator